MFFKIFGLFIIFSLFLATPVLAGDYGLSETAGAAGLTSFGTSLPGLVGNIIGTGLSLVGVLFFALMLYGGVMWMLARGNSEQEKKALDTITAAIVGILIVLGSYALTSFVFNNLMSGGVNNTPPPASVDCTGKKEAEVAGCDTCVAAFPGYSCVAEADNNKCDDIKPNYCNAPNTPASTKCCKQKQ